MKKILQMIFSLMILVLLVFGLWKILQVIWTSISGMQKDIATAIVAGTVTFLVALISIVLGKYYERKLIIEKEIRDKKIPIYGEFIDFFISFLLEPEKYTENDLKSFFSKVTKQLIIWGSDDVIEKWSSYRLKMASYADKEQNPLVLKELMLDLESLLIAIRKDTGHKSSSVKQGSILRMFINDYDSLGM